MNKRCDNANDTSYHKYGGRGIQVCDRWKSFENFLADMGPRPGPEYSIDRFPNTNGDYEPGNCRWATAIEQNSNRRNSRIYEHQDRKWTARELAEQYGLDNLLRLGNRLAAGWDVERAVSQPLKKRTKR